MTLLVLCRDTFGGVLKSNAFAGVAPRLHLKSPGGRISGQLISTSCVIN